LGRVFALFSPLFHFFLPSLSQCCGAKIHLRSFFLFPMSLFISLFFFFFFPSRCIAGEKWAEGKIPPLLFFFLFPFSGFFPSFPPPSSSSHECAKPLLFLSPFFLVGRTGKLFFFFPFFLFPLPTPGRIEFDLFFLPPSFFDWD